MKKILFLILGLAFVGAVVHAERRTKTISATDTNQFASLARASSALVLVNAGANEVYVRVFQEGDSPEAATTADPSVYIPAGASLEFTALQGEGRYFAIAAICSAAETTTLYSYY